MVIETQRLGEGAQMRRGYAVASDSPTGAENIMRPKLTDDEALYVLAMLPGGHHRMKDNPLHALAKNRQSRNLVKKILPDNLVDPYGPV